MVALNELFHHNGTTTRSRRPRKGEFGCHEKSVRAMVSVWAVTSVANVNHQSPLITDQQSGVSDDLFIDQCSSVIERRASANDIQITLAVTPKGASKLITANTTTATAKPVAPTDVKLTYIPSVGVAPENGCPGPSSTFTPPEVKISWTDHDQSVWVYEIFRSSDGGTNYTFVDMVRPQASPSYTYTDTTLYQTKTAGPWKYKVVAVNAVGKSASDPESVQV